MTAPVIEGHFPSPAEADPNRISSARVCTEANITYRQLDWWARTYLIPGLDRQLCPGTGAPRSWTPEQMEFIARLGRLVRGGLQPRAAAQALQAQTVDGQLPDVIRLPGDLEVRFVSPLMAVAQ